MAAAWFWGFSFVLFFFLCRKPHHSGLAVGALVHSWLEPRWQSISHLYMSTMYWVLVERVPWQCWQCCHVLSMSFTGILQLLVTMNSPISSTSTRCLNFARGESYLLDGKVTFCHVCRTYWDCGRFWARFASSLENWHDACRVSGPQDEVDWDCVWYRMAVLDTP